MFPSLATNPQSALHITAQSVENIGLAMTLSKDVAALTYPSLYSQIYNMTFIIVFQIRIGLSCLRSPPKSLTAMAATQKSSLQ